MKPGVRITGGEFRGRGLAVPPGARPTEGRVREALFSIWSDRLAGARVLDLFAGSGVVGLEALGRGALSALAVDQGLQAVKTLEANAGKLGEGLLEIRRLTLPEGLARLPPGAFDLVYADPPYNFAAYGELLEAVAPLLATGRRGRRGAHLAARAGDRGGTADADRRAAIRRERDQLLPAGTGVMLPPD